MMSKVLIVVVEKLFGHFMMVDLWRKWPLLKEEMPYENVFMHLIPNNSENIIGYASVGTCTVPEFIYNLSGHCN